MKVVLDTSVLVAAARSRQGASHAVLLRLADREFIPVISVALFLEYRSVLLRKENLIERSPEEAERFLDALLAFSSLQEIFFSWRPSLGDPVAASCRYIVTHNIRHFRGSGRFGIEVLRPGEFLMLIK